MRTLALMLELLVAVVAWQYFTMAKPVQARVVWLAADCHTAATVRAHTAASVAPRPPSAPGESAREP